MDFIGRAHRALARISPHVAIDLLAAYDVEELVRFHAESTHPRRRTPLHPVLVAWLTVAMALFRSDSIPNVFARLLARCRERRMWIGLRPVTDGALAHARARLKALWQGASEEERARAHTTATAILRTWLGKATREAAAKELGLSAVRLWQLSQQAVCGLVVGCLRQPRFRGRPPAGGYGTGAEGVGALKKKIALLERELDGSRRLIEVMKDLPGNREAPRALSLEAGAGHERVAAPFRRERVPGAADRPAASGAGAEARDGART